MTQVLAILPIDTDLVYMGNLIYMFKVHKSTMDNWGPVRVFGPDPSQYPYYDTHLNPGEYKGIPTKNAILNELQDMKGGDIAIYIDDHSAFVDSAWRLFWNRGANPNPIPNPTLSQIAADQDLLGYLEVDQILGNNRTYFVCRGSGSGEAVTTSILAKLNRNLFCSMHQMEAMEPDFYDVHNAATPSMLEFEHDNQANILPYQTPQKYIGI